MATNEVSMLNTIRVTKHWDSMYDQMSEVMA
jgi:hypothetical protein